MKPLTAKHRWAETMRPAALIAFLLLASWFSSLRAEPRPEERREHQIEYLGEKTGPVEDDLKKRLVLVLRKNPDVQRAYLAVISTDGNRTQSVALCLASKKTDEKLIQQLAAVFRDIFDKDQFLDMMFLTADTERHVRKVCPPFYKKKHRYDQALGSE